MAADQEGTGHVSDHGDREPCGDRKRPGQHSSPAAADGNHEEQRGQEQDLADLADRGRGAEQHSRCDNRSQLWSVAAGEQQRDAGDDRGLEPDVRHDVLLDLDLVRVEQQRGDGDRGEPAWHCPAEQDQVDRRRDRQAKQVLDGGHRAQVADRENRPERRFVADRVGSRIGVIQVLDRVDIQQGRLIGDLGRHPQRKACSHQGDQQPVARSDPPRRAGRGRNRTGPHGQATQATGSFAHGAWAAISGARPGTVSAGTGARGLRAARIRAAIPSAPAGGRVTIAGIWYRQVNSNRSDTPSTITPEAKKNKHASAAGRAAANRGRRMKAITEPARPAMMHSRKSGPGVYPPRSWYQRRNFAIGAFICGGPPNLGFSIVSVELSREPRSSQILLFLTEIHGPYCAVGKCRWNCQRTIGVSPLLVYWLIANSLIESFTMAEATRIGCCRSTARLKSATRLPF